MDEAAPQLEFLGDLASVASAPIVASFDAAGGSMELADGVRVDVPAGAFVEATELTAVVVDLHLDRFVDDAPRGWGYVLSTRDDVELGEPLVLELDRSPREVRARQLVDGVWTSLDLPAGDVAKIQVEHFSSVPTLIVETGGGSPSAAEASAGESPAAFLSACILSVGWMLSDADDVDAGVIEDSILELALSICTRALVSKFTPFGERVDVSCVGENIGGGVTLHDAIDGCLDGPEDGRTDESASTYVLTGSVTAGPIVEGVPGGLIIHVVQNEVELVLDLDSGVATGSAIVSREVDTSTDACTDRKISPLGFVFEGGFDDETQTTLSGTFSWNVRPGDFVQLELEGDCAERSGLASGSGAWQARWDPESTSLDGSLTIQGGLGTNRFELATREP